MAVQKPNHFIEGTPIDPDEVNENFDVLYDEVSQHVNASNPHNITISKIGAAAANHDHAWSEILDKPATATRWPQFDEVTEVPLADADTAGIIKVSGDLNGNRSTVAVSEQAASTMWATVQQNSNYFVDSPPVTLWVLRTIPGNFYTGTNPGTVLAFFTVLPGVYTLEFEARALEDYIFDTEQGTSVFIGGYLSLRMQEYAISSHVHVGGNGSYSLYTLTMSFYLPPGLVTLHFEPNTLQWDDWEESGTPRTSYGSVEIKEVRVKGRVRKSTATEPPEPHETVELPVT